MAGIFSQVLAEEDIAYLLNLPDVQSAKVVVTAKETGSVSFTVSLTPAIKAALQEKLALDLSAVNSIPMRWIKGDTSPHVDTGARTFTDTYLMYLTDSTGEFVVDEESYPITQGTAYRFHEGLQHKTIGTGVEPRLLLGPMSEAGFAVGDLCAFGTSISEPGGTTIYIRQKPEEASGINQYNLNSTSEESWVDITAYPICVENTNTDAGFLKVLFSTDIVLTDGDRNAYDRYFICQSGSIQFGSETLNADGSRPIIEINNDKNDETYPGLIRNNGNSDIRIFNLDVRAGENTELTNGAGWVAQANFGGNNNYIINCNSYGDINCNDGGGIVGTNAASSGSLYVRGCSSYGIIRNNLAGGIVGSSAGQDGGQLTISSCWSTGTNSGGGIIGGNSNAIINNCYSEGDMENFYSGGIVGYNSGGSGIYQISNCYSRGAISGEAAGGIVGRVVASNESDSYSITITNCYSLGAINAAIGAGGIVGEVTGAGSWDITVNHCYAVGATETEVVGYIIGNRSIINDIDGEEPQLITCNNNYSESNSGTPGVWSKENADSVLTGTPEPTIVGTTWVETVVNQPYELLNMGYTPYTTTNIYTTDLSLIRTYGSTVSAGGITNGGSLIISSNGGLVDKDMTNARDIINEDTGEPYNYTVRLDPNEFASFFTEKGMAAFIDGNIVAGYKPEENRLNASFWGDFGNDVFDGWGFFYIYDVDSGKYYFPLITPQNQVDRLLTTQTFTAFTPERTFTITHGWAAQGIFKFDISVNDNKPFRFGAYGNMGSDGDEDISDLTFSYEVNGNNKTLYYQRHAEEGNSQEILYSYWVPKNPEQNTEITYDFFNDTDDNIMMSKEITNGLTVYFGKTNDVKDWVTNDLGDCANLYQLLDITSGNPASYGTITVNSCTGAISTTSSTTPGTYTLYIRSVGSYNITTYDLTVGEGGSSCCVDSQQLIGLDYSTRLSILAGKIMIIQRPPAPLTYADLMRIRKAQATRR